MSNKAKRGGIKGNTPHVMEAIERFGGLCNAAEQNRTYGRISIHAIFEDGVIQRVGETTEITHKLDAA